jgi:hypothetical protein
MEDFNMSKLAGNDLMKDMEFLINELHKEWDRSGATKATVIIGIEESTEVNQTLAAKIMEKQELLEKDELSFKQNIGLSRENYVLLRLIKKIKAKENKTNEKGLDMEFSVPLDKEEYKLFKRMFSPKLV